VFGEDVDEVGVCGHLRISISRVVVERRDLERLTKMSRSPKPKTDIAMMGHIHCTFAWTLQPYQKSEIGTMKAPGIMVSSLCSGLKSPFFICAA
jgi:hypothetical protein